MARFVWTHGVLRWGGFMFCFSLAVFQHAHYGHPFSTEGHWLLRVLFGAVTWALVGALYGRSLWRRNERDYAEQRGGGSFLP